MCANIFYGGKSRLLFRFVFTLLLFASLPSVAFSQLVRGVVYGDEGLPLPGVNITISSPDEEAESSPIKGSATDDEGRYEINGISEGVYTLRFSFIGFNTKEIVVEVGANGLELETRLDPLVIESDEIVIARNKATDLTADAHSIAILEPEDLAKVRGQTLGETLEQLPGITALKTGPSIAKPVVRGLHSQRVLVLNAGVSLEGQQWGGEHAPEIDPFAPVRIEVVRGVAGVEYGMGAIGGVIRLEPLDLPYLPDQGVSGQLSMNGFSNNLQGAGALYLEGAAKGIPGFGWRVQTSVRKAGDTHAPDYIVGNSAFKEFNGSVSLGMRRENYNIVGIYSRFSTELGIFNGAHIGNLNDLLRAIERGEPSNEGDFGYDIGLPKQDIAHDLITVHGDFHLESGHTIEAQYGFQNNHRQEFDAHGRGDADSRSSKPAFDLSLLSHSVEFKFQHNPTDHFVGVVGFNGLNQLNKNDASGFLIPNFRALSGGIFARETWVKDRLSLEAGLRYDYRWVRAWPRENGTSGPFVRRISNYSSFSGVFGGIWQFQPQWSIGANIGTGWRPPSVNELYNFGVHHGTAQFEQGNPDLDSERSLGLDATLRHYSPSTRLEFSIYSTSFDQFIYLFPDPEPRVTIRGTFPSFQYVQSDAVLRGFDLSFDHDLIPLLTFGVQASMVRGDNRDTDEPLINMPADRLIPRLTFHLHESGSLKQADLHVEGVFVNKQTRIPPNVDYADPPDGYVLLNMGISTTFSMRQTPIAVNLEVQNALNTSYRDYLSRFRYFIDDPGRSVVLRLQIPIN